MLISLLQGLAGTHGGTVVKTEDQVDGLVGMLGPPLTDCAIGGLLGPIALQGCHHMEVGVLTDDIYKTLMTLDGRRRTFQTLDHHDASMVLQPTCHILTHLAAHFIVVGTDKGGKLLRVCLTLKYDDGYAAVEGTVDGGRDGLHLVGCHNQQVDACMQQTVYLLYLTLITIVGSGKAQLHAILEVGAHAQLGVLLLTPDVGRTLGNAYHIAGLLGCTAYTYCQQYKHVQHSQ